MRKCLACLKLCRLLRRTKGTYAGGLKSVHKAKRERHFRADDHEVNMARLRLGNEDINVAAFRKVLPEHRAE